jgi:hypothetical protein
MSDSFFNPPGTSLEGKMTAIPLYLLSTKLLGRGSVVPQQRCQNARRITQAKSPRQVEEIFLFSRASRPALEPTQARIQWVPLVLSQGLKRPEGEVDHTSI